MVQAIIVKGVVGAVAAIASLRFGAGFYAFYQTEQLERPSYTVVETLENGVEIRHYDSYLIAETTIKGSGGFREPTKQGFRDCAGYIFGKNKKRSSWFRRTPNDSEKMKMTAPVRVSATTDNEKMAMTAPVRILGTTNDSKAATKVSFVIGKQYTEKTAPKPLDRNVKVRTVPAHTLAVRVFPGPPPTDERVQDERRVIEAALQNAGKAPPTSSCETLVYGYHDPFITPRFLRRNEVAVVLEGSI